MTDFNKRIDEAIENAAIEIAQNNMAITKAAGLVIDDLVVENALLRRHLRVHRAFLIALLISNAVGFILILVRVINHG
jgi:hypothetical protein